MSVGPIASFKRGDDIRIARVEIKDGDTPVDLTQEGYSWVWQIRPTPNDPSFYAVTIDDTDASSGVLIGSLSSAVTKTMTPGEHVSDVELTTPGGVISSRTFTFEVEADVSRAEEVAG